MAAGFESYYYIIFLLVLVTADVEGETNGFISAVGDPGMKRDGLRVAIEAWNQCNEAGEQVNGSVSPRAADCFDVHRNPSCSSHSHQEMKNCSLYNLKHKVKERDNMLGIGQALPQLDPKDLYNPDIYAYQKEIYLGSKCEVKENDAKPWQFWMIMLKNGNLDTTTGPTAKCPKNGIKVPPFREPKFSCFGEGCMNQPRINHSYTDLSPGPNSSLMGSFYGTWDLSSSVGGVKGNNASFFSVMWRKDVGKGSWTFYNILRTSQNFQWLMLYLRADATAGFSGGYHYPTRGMLKIIPQSPNFNVTFSLAVYHGGGSKSQFYLLDIGSCWKNNGMPCDGDVTTDVTRYSEMILNPATKSWCDRNTFLGCPLYHTFPNGTTVYRNDTANFPYGAYHYYCAPGNAEGIDDKAKCDPYSNPQPQEIVQLLPHPVWGEYGYPTKQGEGWIGDPRTWNLDVGRLSHNLYFYQDPGAVNVTRNWTSIDLGTEIFNDPYQVAEWSVSDFNVLVPRQT
ncbi:unnamed protein product [Cuscuta epithymum]|uniref:DUF7705 domain-containing protein n=2 Tax=Cuscuta epithymum TaxID=186058 RepID=A0AAV0DSC0_9ASTE|nr:unnamed protein product [Cuscuta epithymum]